MSDEETGGRSPLPGTTALSFVGVVRNVGPVGVLVKLLQPTSSVTPSTYSPRLKIVGYSDR